MILKFRGWDTTKKRMYTADELGADQLTISPDGKGFINVSGTDTRFSQLMHHIRPLQFTGRYDKEHKEIYNGDLLKGKDGRVMLVGWNDKCTSFSLNSEGWMHTHWFGEACSSEDCEVIGNRYENPGLFLSQLTPDYKSEA